ncbi:hypothetical protein O3P69_002721 [Scylla paramamosain]|uniref:Uncharacterized protein n=1 Tax=Scylla paramamosain TaxID=85552 RepID=A0AAW0UN86_SCYPA
MGDGVEGGGRASGGRQGKAVCGGREGEEDVCGIARNTKHHPATLASLYPRSKPASQPTALRSLVSRAA